MTKYLLLALILAGCSSLPTSPLPSVAPSVVPSPAPSLIPKTSKVDVIRKIARESACARFDWNDRGVAPVGYMEGIALSYSNAVCDPVQQKIVGAPLDKSKSESERDTYDSVSWYNSNFENAGLGSIPNLRKAWTLVIGLGPQESSGQYCCGADYSQSFYKGSGEGAEAGLFQASYGARSHSSALPALYAKYKADQSGCLLDVFKAGVSCDASDATSWGTNSEAVAWQKLTKSCPRFAAEYAAILVRVYSGNEGEFSTLGNNKDNKKYVEVVPACAEMLEAVESVSDCGG